MAYATAADMIAQLGEREVIALTDRDNLGVVDATVLSDALDKASAEIDGYLAAGGYQVPLASPPPILAIYCCDIGRYRLVGAAAVETETARNRYKDAIKFLESVRDGRLKLGGSIAAPGGSVSVVGGGRIFTSETLADFTGG